MKENYINDRIRNKPFLQSLKDSVSDAPQIEGRTFLKVLLGI